MNWKNILIIITAFVSSEINYTPQIQAQPAPYDIFPEAKPPYYRVRYEPSTKQGELIFGVNYTAWIPPGAKTLKGVIVHQHGCGEGSCKSGLTGAFDLHWQALAKKHGCALISPSYEQPEKADCQMWCDPRNGSGKSFQQCLKDLGEKSGHPEMSSVPWALWGHSGGGHWAGGMLNLHPEKVAAAWFRSGVPLLKEDPKRTTIKAHQLNEAVLEVPVMCNFGTKEGYTVKDGRFAGVWPANEFYFNEIRSRGGLICMAIDPLTAHECGNQRYLAIRWLDYCLEARLPEKAGDPLKKISNTQYWLAEVGSSKSLPNDKFEGDKLKANWLPNAEIAQHWTEFVTDTKVTDTTAPPSVRNVKVKEGVITWEADSDLESGIAGFIIERDGKLLVDLSTQAKNPFGRPVFQGLQYSDTPNMPLIPFEYVDKTAEKGKKHQYKIFSVNTTGLKSR